MRAPPKNDFIRGLLWWVPGCLIFFRQSFTTGFDQITGDPGDTRLAIYLHEHWVNVARDNVSWTSPEFYYPTKGVLGYTDTNLLNEVFYMPLRALGLDPFLAFMWTLILLSGVGFVGMFVFLRRALGLSGPTCAALATAFAFANNLYDVAGHTQLYSVYWLPLLLILIREAVIARDRNRRLAWGWSAGALLGLLFYTSYYTGWFATFAAIVFAFVILVWRVATRGLADIWALLRRHRAAAAGGAVGFGLALIPFLITYLPAQRLLPGRTYAEALSFMAWPSDVFNLGANNYLWGSAVRGTLLDQRIYFTEVRMALTPILMLAALASCVFIVIRRRSVAVGFAGEACVAAGIVLVFMTVLPMKFGTTSLWAISYALIPGATALRAVDRMVLITGLPAVMIIGIAIRALRERVDRFNTRRAEAIGIAFLLGLIVLEQLNVSDSANVDRSKELTTLIAAPQPPAECRSFYITDSGTEPVPFYISVLDAMLLSQHFSLPTLNGYSGHFAPGYDFVDPKAEDYVDRARNWATNHGLIESLCSYDRATRLWAGPDPGV